jgi:hypothetical protein
MRAILSGLLVSLFMINLATSSALPSETVYGQALASARIAKIGDMNAKLFWDAELALADCKARNAKLVLYESGPLEWSVEIMSREPDDD